ncbi:hypothetical protein BSKO_08831 [Bryopsis sp. KO-2023]|nr:hypothetical protein BSKO_08831 [Bryopsis sp. KO-2023]
MAFLSRTCDAFWNGLDSTIHTLIPEKVRNVLGQLQPAFNFTASKYVLIKDWRLGVVLRTFQVAILIYILADVFRAASYLESEVPKGVILPFTPAENRKERKTLWGNRAENATKLSYCTDPDEYNFEYQGQKFEDITCMFAEASSLSKKGDNQYFITTYTNVDKLVYIKAAERGDCGQYKPDGYSLIIFVDGDDAGAGGACVYESSASYFPIGADTGRLKVLHGYFTSIVEKNGGNPKTYVRNAVTKEQEVFQAGDVIDLTVERWLDIAGVKLDLPMDAPEQVTFESDSAQTGSGDYKDRYPRLRLSGVNILVNMNYYTRKLAPPPWKKSTGKGADDIICVIDVTPVYRWSLQGSDIRHSITRPDSPIFLDSKGLPASFNDGEVAAIQTDLQNYGIQFSFQIAGNVGRFAISALIAALVAGSVLLSVAQVLVTFVALYGMGLSSQLYMEFMRESVDWRKEYARFAAQALVAGYAFMGYDENNSFRLDRKEIFKTLKTILGQRLPEDKLAALADFVMRQGEEDVKVSKGAFRLEEGDFPASNLISIEEWINIFTEEKVSLAALERLIDNEYKDVRTRDFLVRMAQGVRMRGLPTGEFEEDGVYPEDGDGPDPDVDPEILEFQQSAKRQMTQAFLANMGQSKSEDAGGPDVEKGD